MATPAPPAARRNYRVSQLIAQRAVTEARRARPSGLQAILAVISAHQIAQAQTSQAAVAQMLLEQQIQVEADALLNLLGFTTNAESLDGMLSQVNVDSEFDRLVESIVQDAGRAAESVAVAARPNVFHVRYVNLPCCSRCAILASRIYRWSTGFQRHPGCDCSMIPTTVASPYRLSPTQLVATGQVRGLSKADLRALDDGADLGQLVNVRLKRAGLLDAGHALTRAGKPTPAAIYRIAGENREDAVRRLKAAGYLR